METKVNLNLIYSPSDNIVAREIEGELIIIPLVAGIGDMEDELFTLNETGRAIWNQMDGKKSLENIVKKLSAEYDVSPKEIEGDVMGFVGELVKRGIIIEVSGA